MGSLTPDAQCGLDEGGDAHTGEDGANELADHVLVTAHTCASASRRSTAMVR